MKFLRVSILFALLGWFASPDAHAHVGSPNIFFEGTAAGIPVRVVIKPPGVIPGLAEITIRTTGPGVEKVTVRTVFGEVGKKGSPHPDEATLVRGETNLYAVSTWFMKRGAYSIHVDLETAQGQGEVVIPVNSVVTVRNGMPPALGTILVCLGGLLFVTFIAIIGAAATESTQAPGQTMTPALRRQRLGWTAAAALFLVTAVAGGKAWWAAEDRDYYEKRISRAWPTKAEVKVEEDRPVLNFSFEVPDGHRREWSPLILDHGKWSHLFLISEPAQDVFVHLHPYQLGERKFAAVLPPLPAGTYHLYADISHESGLYRTLYTEVNIPESPADWAKRWTRAPINPNDPLCGIALTPTQSAGARRDLDMDDAWHIETVAPSASQDEAALMNGLTMKWSRPPKLIVNQDVSLRFQLSDAQGQPATLEPYLGMGGHLVVRRNDGSVFIHAHPEGNISMASQAILAARSENPQAKEAELFAAASTNYNRSASSVLLGSEVSFPYAFPKAGTYRLWVQFKHQGQILTASYLAEVAEK